MVQFWVIFVHGCNRTTDTTLGVETSICELSFSCVTHCIWSSRITKWCNTTINIHIYIYPWRGNENSQIVFWGVHLERCFQSCFTYVSEFLLACVNSFIWMFFVKSTMSLWSFICDYSSGLLLSRQQPIRVVSELCLLHA